jgi:hypothetical protein
VTDLERLEKLFSLTMIAVESMQKAVDVIVKIAELTAKPIAK